MKKGNHYVLVFVALMASLFVLVTSISQSAESLQENKGQREQAAPAGVEISTEELKQILLEGKFPVIDVRPKEEYAVSHIPGSVNIFETEIEQMMKLCPDKSSGLVLYCNGPHCHKTGRVAEMLSKKDYTNIKKYRDGLPVWLAFGNAAETSLSGFKYVCSSDSTAVLVDARSKEEYGTGTIKSAVNLQAGDIEAANKDGRLPYTDHGTRIIVFGNSVAQARLLAEAIAQRAYWNSSYVTETYENLKKSGL